MTCPECGKDTKVIDTNAVEHGRAVRRRRECLACEARFTTYERLDAGTDRAREDFCRAVFALENTARLVADLGERVRRVDN